MKAGVFPSFEEGNIADQNIIPSRTGIAFQLDRIVFGIFQINRRSVSLSAVVVVHFSEIDSRSAEVFPKGFNVERFDSQADVIHVVTVGCGSRTTSSSNRAVDTHEVNQMRSRAKVNESESVHSLVQRAPQDIAVELNHPFNIAASDDDVVQSNDLHSFIVTASAGFNSARRLSSP